MQNPNGGFATYELVRGTEYMELINPAEVFVSLNTLWTGSLADFTLAGQHYDRIQLPRMHDRGLDCPEHLQPIVS